MKVLFAVSNEEISESIVKKYQKDYKQIISYKNVYYFNAILKELQKDKTYDRVVISEDLEAFTHTQYDQIDKFIFEKLDSISDEASDSKGNDTPIIVICSDRRTKAEQMLVKLFGIGVYNAIIGNDRSIEELCKLINRPRTKKEAKNYYKIDAEDVNYQSENENDVSETEIQNILAHYKRLGKNEDRYIDSFNNIAAQYNDTQLRIISKFLPLNVRAVLEERSPKYQQIMSFHNSVSDQLRNNKKEVEEGLSGKLLIPNNREKIMSKPVVIPSSVNMNSSKKLARHKPQNKVIEQIEENIENALEEIHPISIIEPEIEPISIIEPEIETISSIESKIEKETSDNIENTVELAKKGRGRPRKNPVTTIQDESKQPKRGRGRPRKNLVQEEKELDSTTVEEFQENSVVLPGFDEDSILKEVEEDILSVTNKQILEKKDEFIEEELLPGFDEDEIIEQEELLPGFEQVESREEELLPGFEQVESREEELLPGFEQVEPIEQEEFLPSYNQRKPVEQEKFSQGNYGNNNFYRNENTVTNRYEQQVGQESKDLSNLLTQGKKIITFVGTSKNGTSFIVNNLAELLSSTGINTAILDTTKNRNSYYIYTKNEEELRQIAARSIDGLANGFANGISVNKNLTIYTSLPNEGDGVHNVGQVLETLLKHHSLILIDTDFETPMEYFKQSQETCLVQTLDILTIQPLTAFLRELKSKNILDERKLRVILNKTVKIRGITDKTIIGGMAYYNDPAMSFMTELFDRNLMRYVSIPFEEETYTRYLENIIECNISLKGYSKAFMQTLKELANMVYPTNGGYKPPTASGYGANNTFSPSINNTLNQMKNNY